MGDGWGAGGVDYRHGITKNIAKILPNFLTDTIATQKQQMEIETRVDTILALKKKNPKAHVNGFEAEIDNLVYQLYGLTEEEIKIVESSS